MTGTTSYYSEKIADKILSQMPLKIGKLRPNSVFSYDIDGDDYEIFKEYTKDFEEIVQRAVFMACSKFWKYYKVRNITDEKEREQQIVKDDSNHRNDGLNRFSNIKVNLILYPTTSMRNIGPKIERELIVVDGRIMAVGEKSGYMKRGWVYCTNGCDSDQEISAGPTLRNYIPKCPTCHIKMRIRTATAETEYVQTIMIQEIQTENLTQRPITFHVKVTGDNVFDTWIGKRIRIAGNFITDLEANKDEHKQFIFAKYMHEIQENNNTCLAPERIKEIIDLLKDPINQIRLFKSFAPAIEGRLPSKESILYALVGGSPKEVRRVDINILEIGNAGKGKSETIKQITRVMAKSMYFLGQSATAAGLGIGMVKLGDQTQVPQGGPLVLCSPHGAVAIDELDKMHPEDVNALLSSMEQQVVTKIVAGHMLSLPSQVSILAAANPKYGEWDEKKPVVDNVDFNGYLLTRFDIVRCDVKTNNIQKLLVATKILGLNPISDIQELKPLLAENELAQYLNYCRLLEPTIPLNIKKELQNFYMRMSELTEGQHVVPMTPRELEGMIRLITARAKLLGKLEVDLSDFEAIRELKKDALSSFPGVKFAGEGQQLSLLSSEQEQVIEIDKIIDSCKDEKGHVDNVEVIQKWVDAKIYKDIKTATREFEKQVGTKFFMRGARFKVGSDFY